MRTPLRRQVGHPPLTGHPIQAVQKEYSPKGPPAPSRRLIDPPATSDPPPLSDVCGSMQAFISGTSSATTLPQRRPQTCKVGTAGWAVPRAIADNFPSHGSALQRYAARFSAVEINSTFYRSHRRSTYVRWVDSTPPDFEFAVKLPRTITHDARLLNAMALVAAFRGEAVQLGQKLGPLLVQLPPGLAFDPALAERFFRGLRDLWPEAVVCEPRHASWFDADAEQLLSAFRIARAAADPRRHPTAATPGGWRGLSYWRLHGSPQMYRSSYDDPTLQALASAVSAAPGETWCVFDNTTSGAAAENALRLQTLLSS